MYYRALHLLLALCVIAGTLTQAAPRKKKGDEEPKTQVLEVLPDPPAAVTGNAERLSFLVTPLSAKGLLSQQVKDALKNLTGRARKGQILTIRAFVAGSGDMRRVTQMVSEIFTEKRLPLPAVTVVQVGALPLQGAQVLLEATVEEPKPVNPGGLGFVSLHRSTASEFLPSIRNLLEQTKLPVDSIRQMTCYLDSLQNAAEIHAKAAAALPGVTASWVQLRRGSTGDGIHCEAIASLAADPGRAEATAAAGRIVFVKPGRLALTGAQLAFGEEERDVSLALDRLGKALSGAHGSWKTVLRTDIYALSTAVRDKVAAAQQGLTPDKPAPASTTLIFEGLPSLDATFAVSAIAVAEPTP